MHWKEIIGIAGQQFFCKCLTKAIGEKVYKFVIEIDELKFGIILYFIQPTPFFQIRDNQKHKEILELISTTTTLKKSYISYLATNDIFTIIKNQKWPLTKEDFLNLESVKALAFFKVHSIYEKPISIYKTLISRLFEQYSSLRFFFTGLLMDKLLSESK